MLKVGIVSVPMESVPVEIDFLRDSSERKLLARMSI